MVHARSAPAWVWVAIALGIGIQVLIVLDSGLPRWASIVLELPIWISLLAVYRFQQRRLNQHLHQIQQLQQDVLLAHMQADQVARVVHDMGSPIQGLWGGTHTNSIPERRRNQQRFVQHLDHLHELVHLLHEHVIGRSPALRCRPLNAFPIALAAIDAANARVPSSTNPVNIQESALATMVWAEPTALRRILDNLITNALDATSSHGPVLVELWNDPLQPGSLTISVLDCGIGLTAEQQQRMFEPYVRFRSAAGMGLGLSIVATLTQQIGGVYGVSGTPGRSTRVWIRLRLMNMVEYGSYSRD